MIRFTELRQILIETHPEWDMRVVTLATRVYLGIDSLENLTTPLPVCYPNNYGIDRQEKPLLSTTEAYQIEFL